MNVSAPGELLERVRTIPAGRVLLEQLPRHEAVYLVGGAVRDMLLGRQPNELDLVVEGDGAALARALGGPVLAHDRFGTCRVRLDGHSYDIAAARTETYSRPGALPDVAPATLAEDLRRRDFTVNALAMALSGERAGELEVAPGALEDLTARRLRVLGDRSFIDDPTRLLRLARYSGRLAFAVEARTRTLALDAIRSGALETVSGPRIGNELRLLARERDPLAGLAALHELGVDRAIHPRLGLRDPEPARRALALLPADGRRDLLVLAAAAERVPRSELARLLDRLAFEAPDRVRIVAGASEAESLAETLRGAKAPSKIAAAIGAAHPELVALAGGHCAATAAGAWLSDLRHVSLEIDGEDLLAAGVPQGPLIGQALAHALAAKLDGRVRGREQELAVALQAVR